MNAAWKESIRIIVGCFVIALVVLVLCSLRTSLRAEQRSNDSLRADLDTYKRAGAAYAEREAELERNIAAAQDRATRAENAAVLAQSRFDEYRRGVTERNRALSERINSCLSGVDDLGDRIDHSIKLVDLCIELDQLLEPGAH